MSAVILAGWNMSDPPFSKVELTKVIRNSADIGLAEAKSIVDRLSDGTDVELVFDNLQRAETFCEDVSGLGVRVRAVSAR